MASDSHNKSMISLRAHWLAFLFAITIAAIVLSPYIYFMQMPQYKGVALTGQDAEEHYVAQMQQAYDGHPLLGNTFLPYKHTPYLQPPLGTDIVAWLGELLHISAVKINVLSKFAFPFIAFLIAYGLVFEMSKSRLAALVGATLAMLGTDLMSYPLDAVHLLHGVSLNDGIYWARPINPEVSGTVLFGELWLIYRSYMRPPATRIGHALFIGCIFGLTLYISPYPWLFLGTLLLLLFAYYIWRGAYHQAISIGASGILGGLLAIPFVLHYLQYKNYPGYANAALQNGALHSHAMVFGIWVFVLLLVPLFAWPKKFAELQGPRVFFIACAAALFLVLNQQVVTGVYLQPGHFHWYITKPLVGILLGVWLAWLLQRFVPSRAWHVAAAGLVLVILFAHAALAQVHFYNLHAPQAIATQSYMPALAYLNTLSPQVVFANPSLSDYIAMYTVDDAPGDASAGLYIAPKDYFEERLFLQYRLRGIAPQQVLAQMQKEQPAILQSLYGIYYPQVLQQLHLSPEATIATLAQKYTAGYARSLPALMQHMGVTMLLQDTASDAWAIAPASGLIKATTIDSRFIFYTIPANAV